MSHYIDGSNVYYQAEGITQLIGYHPKVDTIRIDNETVADVTYQFDLELGQYVEQSRTIRTEPDPNYKSPTELKLAELNAACNETILAGFTSNALGTDHSYDFDDEAQRNLTGRLALINAKPDYPNSFLWKTKDIGPLPHTKFQFIDLCTDADIFKDSMIARYWTLKYAVLSATTPEEIEAIHW